MNSVDPSKPLRLGVLRPRLPRAEQLLPYLQAIDSTRVYSNRGPLVCELESRFSARLQLPEGGTLCTASGTAAIVGAILASAGRANERRPLAMIPAFTFVATAAAVQQCGYEPYLLDVTLGQWMLDPASIIDHPLLDKVGVVVPVAPFGRPVRQKAWCDFNKATKIPVVIDGAAAFDTIGPAPRDYLGDIPVAFSFHATKSFGTGEGGAVLCNDPDFIRDVERCLNFGFYGSRDSRSANINGKMSEYGAAVGLAELDGWTSKLAEFSSAAGCYRDLMQAVQLSHLMHVHPDISATYALVLCPTSEQARKAEESLDLHDIDCRRWYGEGIQGHSYYQRLAHGPLDATTDILPRLIGLPMAPDLSREDVGRVVEALRPTLSA